MLKSKTTGLLVIHELPRRLVFPETELPVIGVLGNPYAGS
jgi:hypothetical protein